ncbi:MAG: phage tail tape measure protein, partial [Victivallales bacterium]|nr:phage tail tape measure protein [Victivallales bacterium]
MSSKINLASIPKDALKVTGGSISIAPESITLDIPEAIRNNGILRLEKPLGVHADVVVKPIALNLPEGYIGKLDKPISVKSTIKIDPLPGDEITKMNELVTQIDNVNNAYKPFSETLDHIKNTLTQINTLMSEEVKMVIRGAAKKGVTDADAIAKKTKQDLANQAKIDALKTAREHELNKTRRQLANEEWELRKDLQENYSGGLKYDETIALQRDLTAAYTEGEQKIQDARTRGAFVMNFAKDRADKLTQSVRENVAQTMEQAKSLARATADASRHSKALRDVSLAMQDYGRVQKVNMIDPLARLKAELGDTNSRLVDLGRTFGIYMSGRTIVNYFRQASESANNFALEIRRIQSLATDFDFGALRDGLLDIDARFGNVHHNAQALYWAYSSGVRGSEEDLVKFTEHMSKLSTTIKSDIMPTIDAATSIMNAFNLSASSAAEIGDTLLGIVKFGKSNAQQLTTSLGHVVAPAAALNVSLDELGATAATLTRTMKTNRAFTYLSNILG